jgi:type I restriction enzyme, R subunit
VEEVNKRLVNDANNAPILNNNDNIPSSFLASVKEETDSLIDTTSVYSDEEFDIVPGGISEKDAQEYIIRILVERNGFIRGRDKNDKDYKSMPINPRTGIDIDVLVRFIKETQPHVWDYFSQYSEPTKEIEELVKLEKESRGTLSLICDGIPASNDRPAITIFYNASSINKEQQALWEKNFFLVYDEVKYETIENPTRRIDLVLAVNGVPFAAIELKNELTGQSTEHAEEQFRSTRSNLEPLLKPVTGCLVYYSMSRREVAFTTVLRGANTKFLPFNKGYENGKGNPPVDDMPQYNGFRTHYMMDEIWTREALTDVLSNFMHVDSDVKNFRSLTPVQLSEVPVIAPRYHQFKLVRDLIKELSKSSAIKHFLIQHSAGSGKTLSITWLAHLLVRLATNDENIKSKFDHAIVVTDRVAIVRQLERSIRMINKHDGLVAEVKNSSGLVKAIKDGKKIIVTTVQKFGKLKTIIGDLSGAKEKNFALIIDEAHSGQTGENASAIVDLLGKSLADEAAEEDSKSDSSIQNITYFAFTATPKPETLMKFGSDNKPYHIYSMKQAIQEGQILNVLKNYTNHEIFNKIYNTGDDKNLPSSIYAKRAMNSYIRSSKENLEYKVAVILEHMVTGTLCNIGGLGRGMVVVSSRQDVEKYFSEIKRQIAEFPELYDSVKPMAAFTDKITVNGKEVTDADLNGFKDTEIPARLSEEDLTSETMRNLLIVADKYQTGFDEPLLCSMYIDKRLSGITAVQTLSRLNRIRKQNDKEDVAVLDFQDNESDIRKAFATYDVEARIKTHATLTDIEQSALAIYAYGIVTSEQVDKYYEASLKVGKEDNASTIMSNIVNRVLDRIEDYRDSEDRDVKEAFDNFKYETRNFVEDFIFVSQFKEVRNSNLRGLHLILKLVLKLMKSPRSGVQDNSWLANIKVEIAQTIVTQKNISGGNVAASPGSSSERSGASGLNPNEYDRPITVEELVAEYNERLKTLIFATHGVESDDNGGYSQQKLDDYDLTVFDNIIVAAFSDSRLEEFSKNRSSQRFESENTRKIVDEIILDQLMEDKITNKDNPNYINLPSMYNNNDEFAARIQKYVLSSIYQMFLRKRIDANKAKETN